MQIVFASSNLGKIDEVQKMLAGTHITIVPQSSKQISQVPENGSSFIENALIKARHAAQKGNCATIADDSGIEVEALDGRPGIYSSRFAGETADDEENLTKLIAMITELPEQKRTARFVCLMVYLKHALDPTPIIAQGFWRGHLVTKPVGENGFGYDPIFYIREQNCTAAQLPTVLKNILSHRGQALRRLITEIRSLK